MRNVLMKLRDGDVLKLKVKTAFKQRTMKCYLKDLTRKKNRKFLLELNKSNWSVKILTLIKLQ